MRPADRRSEIGRRGRGRQLSERVPRTLHGPSPRRIGVALVMFFLLPLSARADDTADGRRHAQRASHLSASGKCKQAIGEYDKAIAVLHDPALLFNRAECHRKLGNTEAALEDYNQFLSDLPAAPNRAQVEARISELKKAAPPSTPKMAASATSRTASRDQSGPSARRASPAIVPGLDPERTGQVPGAADGRGAGALSFSRPETSVPPPSSETKDGSLTSRPWFWMALGAVAIGTGIAALVVLDRPGTDVPASDLGNYKF
jgi:tetratricopeptide (TPR) repeat protein